VKIKGILTDVPAPPQKKTPVRRPASKTGNSGSTSNSSSKAAPKTAPKPGTAVKKPVTPVKKK
jgi:hypothetical protein